MTWKRKSEEILCLAMSSILLESTAHFEQRAKNCLSDNGVRSLSSAPFESGKLPPQQNLEQLLTLDFSTARKVRQKVGNPQGFSARARVIEGLWIQRTVCLTSHA